MSKTFFLDTSVILDSPENIFTLSQNGENIIVVCETVLSEIDGKKSGFDIINYNAREFNRFCEQSELIANENINHTAKRVVIRNNDITVHLVSLNSFEHNEKNTDPKILNDRRIIETASKISKEYTNFAILSNDVAFRTRALLEEITVDSFKSNNNKIDDIELFTTIELDYDIKLPTPVDTISVQNSVSGFEFINTLTGNKIYGYRDVNLIQPIDTSLLEKQNCVPINIRQKVLSSIMLNNTSDVVVVSGAAGSGKNLIATSAACALRDNKNSPYEKIVYIRKTITSVDNKNEELGFLPGTLEDKMSAYTKPLYNTIETLLKRKYKSFKPKTKEELNEKISEFISLYNIQIEYEGFLRGSTISNAIVILDEFQNDSISSLRLVLTRIGENCKVFILGDLNQIDNPYINKYNSALSYILNETKKGNEYGVNVYGVKLIDTVRSKIAKYADSW